MENAADDGDGAMSGESSHSNAAPGTTEQRVKFAKGTTGAEISGSLKSGASARYVLGAKNEQFLYVRVAPHHHTIEYQIFNPDGSTLLGMISSDKEYKGQLWQNGDHVIEVINRSSHTVKYNVIFGIE